LPHAPRHRIITHQTQNRWKKTTRRKRKKKTATFEWNGQYQQLFYEYKPS